jgi:uncharacterized RDD family membrane protein YckC
MASYGHQPERQLIYICYPPLQPYGGFWRRVLAYVIDALVVGLVVTAARAVIDARFNGAWPSAPAGWYLFSFAATWLYFALMESSCLQATLGKLGLSMRVTDLRGNRISFARASGRWFAKILSVLFLNIGFLMVAFTPRKRGLHDYVAGTLVCKAWAVGPMTAPQPTQPIS